MPSLSGGKSAKGKKPSSKKSKTSHRTLIIIASVAATVAIIGAVAAKVFLDRKQQEEYEAQVVGVAQNANDIVEAVNSALTSTAPTTWVYDSEENLLMTIKLSSTLQSVATVPSALFDKIVEDSNGDPYTLIVTEFLSSTNRIASGATLDGYIHRVRSEFQDSDLIRYLAITSTYGGQYTGLEDAANNYFGESSSRLNDAQQQFIAYTYRDSSATPEAYIASTGISAERMGFFVQGNTASTIKSIVVEQLSSIQGIDLNSTSYSVKTTLSSQHMSAYQSILDSSMRQLIDLNADGSYALNCSVAVVDKMTGFVRAYIPSRSSNTGTQSYFQLNSMQYVGNWQALMEQFSIPYTYGFSLREITKSNGDKELRTVSELFEEQELSDVAGDGFLTPLSLANLIYSGNSTYRGISFIYQVIDESGMTVYRSDGVSVLTFDNPMVSEYFSEDSTTRTMYGDVMDLSTGCVAFRSTKSYDIFIVAGSGAIGGSVTSANREILHDAITALEDSVAKLYPTPDVTIWDATSLAVNKPKAFDANFLLVQPKVQTMLEDLEKIEIDSSDARKEFEAQYDSILQYIATYRECIGDAYADRLKSVLSEVRLDRALLLTMYSV